MIENIKNNYAIFDGNSYHELHLYDDYLDSSTIRIVNFGGNNKFKTLYLWQRLFREIVSLDPDIVHITHLFPPYGFYYYLFFRNKLIVTIHDPIPHSGEASLWTERLRRFGLKRVKAVVLLNQNEDQTSSFCSRYRIRRNKIFYSSLGPYDVLRVIPDHNNSIASSDFLFIGRISPYKGVDILLKAMDLLHKKNSSIRLIIAGAGDFWFDINPYLSRDNIIITNRFISITELVSLINHTKFVVCPYSEGTQSGVIMSALALQKPVIATDVGDFSTIISDGVNGFLVEPNSIVALAETMEKALSSQTTIRRSITNKTWIEISKTYLDIYNNILRS